jgi:hypothetical protein
VRRAYSLHLLVEVDRTAADGQHFVLCDAFSNKRQMAFNDIMALKCHIDGIIPPDDVGAAIPRMGAGTLDTFSPEFRYARRALHLKSGYAGLDCDKALRWADGDADRALARLIETNGYASTKV